MSIERPEFSMPPAGSQQMTADRTAGETVDRPRPSDDRAGYQSSATNRGEPPQDVTVVVRGEAVRTADSQSPSKDAQLKGAEKSPTKKVSEAKKLKGRPACLLSMTILTWE